MDEGSEEFRLARTKLELNHQLARLGLKGTLWGAWATLLAIVLIVAIQAYIERYILDGWPLAAFAAVVVVSAICYGAFIFNHTLKFSAKMDKDSRGVSIDSRPGSSAGETGTSSQAP